ncbi:MAG: MCP four helix bundle domain-containing protein, partial [Wenzhouxiangella sp.]|nr:MCP four helix bundle domain-containing protein [Wenzhouxiangella sp.]
MPAGFCRRLSHSQEGKGMSFRNLKIGTKILSGFGAILLIAIVIGVIGFTGLRGVGTSFNQVADQRLPAVRELGDVEANLLRLINAYSLLLDTQQTRAERDQLLADIQTYRAEYAAAQEDYLELDRSAEEQRLYDRLVAAMDDLRDVNQQEVNPQHQEFLDHGLMQPMAVNRDLERFMKAHAELQSRILEAIRLMEPINGGDDPTACNFGRWLPDFRTSNQQIMTDIQEIMPVHDAFHEAVRQIDDAIRQSDQQGAFDVYFGAMDPAAHDVFENFNQINAEAQDAAQALEQMAAALTGPAREIQNNVMESFEELQQLILAGAEQDGIDGDAVIARSNTVNFTSMILGA